LYVSIKYYLILTIGALLFILHSRLSISYYYSWILFTITVYVYIFELFIFIFGKFL